MKKNFFLLVTLSTLLSSCMEQPSAPIDYGNSTASSSKNVHYGESDEIVEKPIIREKTMWGDKQVEHMSPDYEISEVSPSPQPLPETPLRTETISHEVIEGETLDSIASQYKVDRETIIKANKLKAPYKLEELQILQIPPQSASPIESSTSAIGDVITPNSVSNSIPKVTSMLPAPGKVISKFGENHLGIKNNGINIEAPNGTDIRSASAGKVVYSGNDPKFGNLIIIKSENEDIFMAYSHMNDLMLHKGDMISKGQAVGHVGQTGNVTSSQLHFAVRQGKTPIDPIKYLSK